MTEDSSKDTSAKALHNMIQMAYETALDHTKFYMLLDAWDGFYSTVENTGDFALIEGHFEQARILANDPRFDAAYEMDIILSAVGSPALLFDSAGQLIAANAQGRSVLPDLTLSPNAADLLQGAWPPEGEENEVRFLASGARPQFLAVCQAVPVHAKSETIYLVRFETSRWSNEVESALRDKFALSDAEIGVAQLMQKGSSARDIAEMRGRSLETVRTQIKSVLRKSGTRQKAEFVRLLATLQQLLSNPDEAAGIGQAAQTQVEVLQVASRGGDTLYFSKYGAADGPVVLYFTSSSRPEESEEWRKSVAEQGLCVLAPHRFGFGGSSSLPKGEEMHDRMAEGCAEILKRHANGPIVFAGHREAGILAAQVAKLLMDRFEIAAVCLVSTGTPKPTIDAFAGRAENMLRSLVAAHKMPSALELGYRAAARIFHSGRLGENQIISYFFRASPVDTKIVKDPAMRATIRDNIAYCFEDCGQIVRDIALWTSNWDAGLNEVAVPFHFILGDAHDFFFVSDMEDYCGTSNMRSFRIIEGEAQMALYTQPQVVVRDIKNLFHIVDETNAAK